MKAGVPRDGKPFLPYLQIILGKGRSERYDNTQIYRQDMKVLYHQLLRLLGGTRTKDPWNQWPSLQYGFGVLGSIQRRQAEEGSASRLHHTAFSGRRHRQGSTGACLMDAGSGIAGTATDNHSTETLGSKNLPLESTDSNHGN